MISIKYNDYLKLNGKFLLDFWSETCIPCKSLEPLLEKLEKELKLKIYKVDVNENPELTSKYLVRGLPTLVFINDGRVLISITGLHKYDVLKKKLIGFM